MAKDMTDWSLQSVAWLYGYDPVHSLPIFPRCANG